MAVMNPIALHSNMSSKLPVVLPYPRDPISPLASSSSSVKVFVG